jgi:hypothetical protein
VAFFFKQSAAYENESGTALRCPDGVRREFREMPEVSPVVERAREHMEEPA